MKLKFKLLLAFGVMILIFMSIIVYNLFYLMNTSTTIETIVEKKFTMEQYVRENYQIVLAIHADIWDIMLLNIDRRDTAIENHKDNARKFYGNIREIIALVPEQEKEMEELKSAFQYYFVFGSTILNFKDLQEFTVNIDVVSKFKENKNNLSSILDSINDASKRDFETSLFRLNQGFRDTVFITTLFTLMVAVAAVFVALLLAGRLTKPIAYLTTIAQKVAKGDYKVRADVKTKGEVRVLADTFNTMLGEIQQYSENMEGLVATRTKELKESNDSLNRAYEVMKEELKIAQRVQDSLLPKKDTMSQCKDLEIVGKYLAMEDLGGDLYDVIRISEKKWGFLIADVSGHGVAASLITAIAKVSFNSNVIKCKNTGEICSNVNKEICKLVGEMSDYDLTVFVGILDIDTGRFEFTNAAHHPAIVYRKNLGQVDRLHTKDGYIGLIEKTEYKSMDTILKPGDRLVLFTDGIVETRNKQDEFYDTSRLLELTVRDIDKSPDTYVENVINDVAVFSDYAPPLDDRAILCIDYKKNLRSAKSAKIA